MTAENDLSPPWTLIIDQGKPVSIVPSMRLGEVANVEGMKMEDAERIVRLANAEYYKVIGDELTSIKKMQEETYAKMDKFIEGLQTSSEEAPPIRQLIIDKNVSAEKIKKAMDEADERTKPREMTLKDWFMTLK